MEREVLIKLLSNLIAFTRVYKDVIQKVADKEYNTHIAFHSLSGLIETFVKDCQEVTKPLTAEDKKDVK